MAEARANGTGVSQADMLAAILRELRGTAWVNAGMAVPHVMKFLKGVSDDGVQLGAFDVQTNRGGHGTAAVVNVVVSGRDADGVLKHAVLPLAECYLVVSSGAELPEARVKSVEPVSYTSEATAAEFAGIGVPADARHARGWEAFEVNGVPPAPRACVIGERGVLHADRSADARGAIECELSPGTVKPGDTVRVRQEGSEDLVATLTRAGVPGAAAPASAEKAIDGEGVYRRGNLVAGGEG